jgi:hypothetical protein
MPDGSTSSTLELLRNMLIREYNHDLYLFSAISPVWLQDGKRIEILNAPTSFGPVDASLLTSSEGLTIKLPSHLRVRPNRVIIRIPWFYQVDTAEVDGRRVQVTNSELLLSPDAQSVRIRGRIRARTPIISYDLAVRDYKSEYQKRYEEFLRTGEVPTPQRLPSLISEPSH